MEFDITRSERINHVLRESEIFKIRLFKTRAVKRGCVKRGGTRGSRRLKRGKPLKYRQIKVLFSTGHVLESGRKGV